MTLEARYEARKLWAALGLKGSDLTHEQLFDLRDRIMEAIAVTPGCNFRPNQRHVTRKGQAGLSYLLRANSPWFRNRELVSFYPDGFVGFAGWADDKNIKPVLEGFRKWALELKATLEHPADPPAKDATASAEIAV